MLPTMFNGMFGKLDAGLCRLTMNGGLAVKTSDGSYKTYNVKQGRLTNVTSFCFDIGQDFFFVIPTSKVSVGDIILVDKKPKCVIKSEPNLITVLDYDSSEVRQIVPERRVFMGSAYFYGKIVSMFGNSLNLKGKDGMSRVMQMMMMKEMFSNGGKGGDASGMGGLGTMMMMNALMGGNKDKDSNSGNMFENLFDISLDEVTEEETEAEEKEKDGE